MATHSALFFQSSGVSPTDFDWPLDDSSGVLPTHHHASFALTSMFDFFHPKSIVPFGKYTNLSEICFDNRQLMSCDQNGIQLFSAIGKSVPCLRVLDLPTSFEAELIPYLIFQDAFQTLHEFMYLHDYR